jgi:hypothetical protein
MEITRHADGSLTVPVAPDRHAHDEVGDGEVTAPAVSDSPATKTIRPGEGGYTEALAEWDAQQGHAPDEVVSTASGRKEAMAVVHAVAEDRGHVHEAVEALDNPGASADALRHVLVGGTPSVKAFADEVAESEGGEALAPHVATKIIGEVLAEIDR